MTPRPYLAQLPRRTMAHWTRDRLVQIHAELSALRQDLARLKRQATQVGRCHQCHVLVTITICDDGNYRCRRCVLAPKEEQSA